MSARSKSKQQRSISIDIDRVIDKAVDEVVDRLINIKIDKSTNKDINKTLFSDELDKIDPKQKDQINITTQSTESKKSKRSKSKNKTPIKKDTLQYKQLIRIDTITQNVFEAIRAKIRPKSIVKQSVYIDLTKNIDTKPAIEKSVSSNLSKRILIPFSNIKLRSCKQIFNPQRLAYVHNIYFRDLIRLNKQGNSISINNCYIFETLDNFISFISKVNNKSVNIVIQELKPYLSKILSSITDEEYIKLNYLILNIFEFRILSVLYIDDICLYPSFIYENEIDLDEETIKMIDWKRSQWKEHDYLEIVTNNENDEYRGTFHPYKKININYRIPELEEYPEMNAYESLNYHIPCFFTVDEVFCSNAYVDEYSNNVNVKLRASARMGNKIIMFDVMPVTDHIELFLKFAKIFKCNQVIFPGFSEVNKFTNKGKRIYYENISYSFDLRELTNKLFTSKRSDRQIFCTKCFSLIEIVNPVSCTLLKCNKDKLPVNTNTVAEDLKIMNDFWKDHKLPNIIQPMIQIERGGPNYIGFVSTVAINFVKLMIKLYDDNLKISVDHNLLALTTIGNIPGIQSLANIYKCCDQKFKSRDFKEPVTNLCRYITSNIEMFVKNSVKSLTEAQNTDICSFIYDPVLNHKLMIRMYSQSKEDIIDGEVVSTLEFIKSRVQTIYDKNKDILDYNIVYNDKENDIDTEKVIFDYGLVSDDALVLAPEHSIDSSKLPFIIEYENGYKTLPCVLVSDDDSDCEKTNKLLNYQYTVQTLCTYEHVIELTNSSNC